MSASAQYQEVHFLGACKEKILEAVLKKKSFMNEISMACRRAGVGVWG